MASLPATEFAVRIDADEGSQTQVQVRRRRVPSPDSHPQPPQQAPPDSPRGRTAVLARRLVPGKSIKLESTGARAKVDPDDLGERLPQSVVLSQLERSPRSKDPGQHHHILGDADEFIRHSRPPAPEEPALDPEVPPDGYSAPKRLTIGRNARLGFAEEPECGSNDDTQAESMPTLQSLAGGGKTLQSLSLRPDRMRQRGQERNWEKWDTRWDTMQCHLQEKYSKNQEDLVMNSGQEYLDRIKFLDLLEQSQPPFLDAQDRFSTMLRNAATYYVPLGQRRTGWDASASGVFCPIRVRIAEDGLLRSAGAYRRQALRQSTESFRRQSIRDSVSSSRNTSPIARRAQVSPIRVLRASMETPVENPTIEGTPDVVKNAMGGGRRHTIREGKLKRLSKMKKFQKFMDDEDGGLVSSYMNNVNHERTELQRRQSVQCELAQQVPAGRLSRPAQPPPLHLDTTRLVFSSAPRETTVHEITISNQGSAALFVLCTPVNFETLPSSVARDRTTALSAEFSPRGARSGAQSCEPRPSPFLLLESEGWVLPANSLRLRFSFCAADAGSYVQQWELCVAQEADLPPQVLHLCGRAVERDTSSLARSKLEEELGHRQMQRAVQDIIIQHAVGPAVRLAEERLAAASSHAPTPTDDRQIGSAQGAALVDQFDSLHVGGMRDATEAEASTLHATRAMQDAALALPGAEERIASLDDLDALVKRAVSGLAAPPPRGMLLRIRQRVSQSCDSLADSALEGKASLIPPTASGVTGVNYRGHVYNWSWADAAWIATDDLTGGSVRIEPLFKEEEEKELEPQPPLTGASGKRRPNNRAGNSKVDSSGASKARSKNKRGQPEPDECLTPLIVVTPLPRVTVDGTMPDAAVSALGISFRSIIQQLAADVADLVEDARQG